MLSGTERFEMTLKESDRVAGKAPTPEGMPASLLPGAPADAPGMDLMVALELIGSLKNRAAWLGQVEASPSMTASLRACFNALGLSVHMPHGPLEEETGSASAAQNGWVLCVRDREKLRLEAWRP